MPQGQGYAGIPPGPLSAYLGVKSANEAAGLAELEKVGAVQGLLARMQAQQMDAQFRQAIGALGPNPDPSQAAAIAMKFGKPDLAVQFANQVENRKLRETLVGQTDLRMRELAAGREATQRQLAQQADLTRRELAGQADVTRRELAASGQALRRELAASRPPRVTPFESELQKKTAQDYAKATQDAAKTGDQLDLTKRAIAQFRDYTQGQILGTGPIATLGGMTKYLSSKTEALEATFKTINLKNMVATFEGFSRAIDTGPERRAWEATQPGVALDDPTNAMILVGALSLTAKAQAEGEARRRYIESSPDKTLKGYVSPVIGKTSVLFTPQGEPVLIPKEQLEAGKARGLITDKQYEEQILGATGAQAPAGVGWSNDKERRYQELLRKRGGS